MKWILGIVILLFAITMVAQQGQDASSLLPNGQSMAAPETPTMANADVLHQIQSRLSTNSQLNNTAVNTTVQDDVVILSGFVDTEQQHEIATSIAEQFSDHRQIIDQIRLGGSPGEASY